MPDFFDYQDSDSPLINFILSVFNGSDDKLIDQYANVDTVTFSNTESD